MRLSRECAIETKAAHGGGNVQAHPVDGGQWEIVHRVSLRRNRLSMQHRQVRQTTGKDDYVVESQQL